MIRILIADDQELVRTGFRVVLDAEPDLEVVGEAADGLAALDAAETLRPDVVLMDIRMPNLDGIEATRRLGQLGPRQIGLNAEQTMMSSSAKAALMTASKQRLARASGHAQIIGANIAN